METEVARRLNEVCEYLVKNSFVNSKADIAKALGYKNRQALSTILSGRQAVPKSVLIKMAVLYPMIDTDWIRTGEKAMLKEPGIEPKDEGRRVDRFVKYIYASNILVKDALSRLGWTRRKYEIALLTDLSDEQVDEVCSAFRNLNREWLVLGNGPMIRETQEYIIDVVMQLKAELTRLRMDLAQVRGDLARIQDRMTVVERVLDGKVKGPCSGSDIVRSGQV